MEPVPETKSIHTCSPLFSCFEPLHQSEALLYSHHMNEIGHFRVAVNLDMKARLGAQVE